MITTVEELLRHLLLGRDAEDPLLLSAVLHLYSAVIVSLHSRHNLPIVQLPPSTFSHRCLLCPYAHVISHFCGLLSCYRTEMISLRKSAPPGSGGSGLSDIPRLNAIVLDACNTLWRNKAFDEGKENEGNVPPGQSLEGMLVLTPPVYVKLRESLSVRASIYDSPAKLDTKRLLSLVYGYAWQGYTTDFWQTMREANKLLPEEVTLTGMGKLTAIEAKHKCDYLDYLKQAGFDGAHSFLHAFIGSLAKRDGSKDGGEGNDGRRRARS